MSYKLKEIQVTLRNGVVVTADVTAIEEIRDLLKDLRGIEVDSATIQRAETAREQDGAGQAGGDIPESLIETRAGLVPGSLRSKNILAFKDGVPQLLRPSAFSSVADASVVLLFSVEAGLKKNGLEFDAFKGLYELQNIKSGSPVSMLLTNLRNAHYLDSKLYSSDRRVVLTAKGETKAIDVLKILLEKAK